MARKITALFSGAATGVAAAAGWIIPGFRRLTPEQREQKRRLAVNAKGRMGSAVIFDYHEGFVCYKYTIRGVQYAATQDVSILLDKLPEDPCTLLGSVAGMKYLPKNPANSIVVCEDWTGLRFRPHMEQPSGRAG